MSERHAFTPAEIGQSPEADRRITIVSLTEQLNSGEPLPWHVYNALAADESRQALDAVFNLTPQDFTHITEQAATFIRQLPEAERQHYARFFAEDESDPPTIQDILMLSANLVRQATGEHQDDLGLGDDRRHRPLREYVDLRAQPPVKCAWFSREIRATYIMLANRYNPAILKTHRLLQTRADYSTDLPNSNQKTLFDWHRQTNHTYLTVVSYDSHQGIRVTPFDPYHAGRDLWSNDEQGLRALDFGSTRAVDSYLQARELFAQNDNSPAMVKEQTNSVDDSLTLFPSGFNRLTNSLLVSQEAWRQERYASGDGIWKLEKHLARLDELAGRTDQESLGWRLDDEGELVPITLTEYQNEIAEARVDTLAKLEAQRRRITYVDETLTGATTDPEVQTPLGIVALSEAADMAALCNVSIPKTTWKALRDYMNQEATIALLQSALDEASGPEDSGDALRRIRLEPFVPPLLADEETFAAWAEYKVAYFGALTKAGITSWINGLTRSDGGFFGLEYEQAMGRNNNIPRATANFAHLILETLSMLRTVNRMDLQDIITKRFLGY